MDTFIDHLASLEAPEPARYWLQRAASYLEEEQDPRHLLAAACCLSEAARSSPAPLRQHLQSLKAELERRAFQ